MPKPVRAALRVRRSRIRGRGAGRFAAAHVDWSSADAPLAAFAARLMHRGDRPLTENGLRFAVETLRLLWQDDAHVRCGLPALRARAAACLRIHDDSGFFLAGALLAERCQKQTNGIELRA